MDRIAVEPLDEGWAVHLSGIENPMMFSNGRLAAVAARRLADRLGAAGNPVSIGIGELGRCFGPGPVPVGPID